MQYVKQCYNTVCLLGVSNNFSVLVPGPPMQLSAPLIGEKKQAPGGPVCCPPPIGLLLSETRAIKASVHPFLSISVLSNIATGRLQRQTAAAQLLAL